MSFQSHCSTFPTELVKICSLPSLWITPFVLPQLILSSVWLEKVKDCSICNKINSSFSSSKLCVIFSKRNHPINSRCEKNPRVPVHNHQVFDCGDTKSNPYDSSFAKAYCILHPQQIGSINFIKIPLACQVCIEVQELLSFVSSQALHCNQCCINDLFDLNESTLMSWS